MNPPTSRLRRKLHGLATSVFLLWTAAASAQWTGAGAGGAGTDFNNTANWSGGTINGSFVNNTANSTVVLSANHSISGAGLTIFNGTTAIQPRVLTLDGTAGGAREVLTINGNVVLNKSAALSPSITGNWTSGSTTVNVSSTAGLVVGQILSGGSGIVPGSTITAIGANSVTISNPTYSAQSSTANLTIASGLILGSNLELSLGNTVRTFQASGGSGTNNGTITVEALVSSTGASGEISINGGTLVLKNAGNTFSGNISSGGSGVINFESAGALGTGSGLTVNNSSLAYTGSGAVTLARTLVNNNASYFNNNSQGGAGSTLTLTGNVTLNGSNALTLGGSNKAALNELSGQISGTGNLAVDSGISGDYAGANWRVSGTGNSYTGLTTVRAGTLEFSTIASVGAGNSSLGAPTTAAGGNITMGGSGSATLRHVGAASSSDRQLVISDAGSSNTVTVSANGTGGLVLTSGVVYNGSAQADKNRTFVLDGNSTAANTLGNVTFNFSRSSGANGNAILTKSGSGLWVLSGTGSYNLGGGGTAGTFTTNVNAGTLRLASANALPGGIGASGGTSLLTINGGVLELGAGDFSRGLGTTASTVNLSSGGFSAHGGNRTVNLGGSGAQVTWGAGSFLTGGSFQLSSSVADSTVDFQNAIDLGSSGTNTRTVQVNNGSAAVDAILSGVISSSGGTQTLYKSGAGALLLSGANTFDGPINIAGGQLLFSSAQALGTGSSSVTVNNASLAYAGSGSVATANRNIIAVNTATLRNDNAAPLAAWTVQNNITSDSSSRTLDLNGTNTGENVVGGLISNGSGGTLALSKGGSGTWRLANDSNSFTGSVSGSSGTLEYTSVANAGSNSALGAGSSISVNNYTLSFVGSSAQSSNRSLSIFNIGTLANNSSNTSATLYFSGAVTIASGNTLQLQGTNTGANTLSGSISGSGASISKQGSGSWTISGTASHTGSTTVSAGVLVVDGQVTSSALNVSTGGSLAGNGTISQSVTVASGGVLAPGDGILGIGTLNLGGSLSARLDAPTFGSYGQVEVSTAVNLQAGNSLSLTLGATPANLSKYFLINNTGSSAINGLLGGYAQDAVFDLAGQSWQISYTGDFGSDTWTGGNDLVIQAVPEPSTWALVLFVIGLMLSRRRFLSSRLRA